MCSLNRLCQRVLTSSPTTVLTQIEDLQKPKTCGFRKVGVFALLTSIKIRAPFLVGVFQYSTVAVTVRYEPLVRLPLSLPLLFDYQESGQN